MTDVQNGLPVSAEAPKGEASPKRSAKIAGLLYLIVAVFGGLSYGYATARVYVAGDAATTARLVAANAGLVRAGVVANLFQATVWVFLAMLLYLLLRHVSENAARAMVILVAIGTSITCLNEVFPIAALLVSTKSAYALGFGTEGSQALVLLLLDIHHYGFLIAQIFFGLWLLPLGLLTYKSGLFPKLLAALLVVGGIGYLVGMLAVFLVPASGEAINTYSTIPSAVAELWMVGYLLVIGVRSSPATTPPRLKSAL
jgi:hypothetical protein